MNWCFTKQKKSYRKKTSDMRWLTILGALIFLMGCGDDNDNTVAVKYAGALKDIMSGDLDSKIALDTISGYKHLYALGAMDGLKGEIQIFDGTSYNSKIVQRKMSVDSTFNTGASLLIYTQVKQWEMQMLPDSLVDVSGLETYLKTMVSERNICGELPLPFLIEGKVKSLYWHVVDGTGIHGEHSHKTHKNSGLSGQINGHEVVILGFFSENHKGFLTHQDSSVHMHFKTIEDSIAGHVDNLKVGKGMWLKIPKT